MKPTTLALVLFTCACSSPVEQPTAFEVEVHVTSDDGLAVEGARVSLAEGASERTDREGRAKLRLRGREGERVSVVCECPAGYERSNAPVSVTLVTGRSVRGEPLAAVPLDLRCDRVTRDVVVLVDAPGAASVPVNVQGLPAASTDSNGSAHIVLSVSRDVRTLEVSLDTARVENIVPRMPSRTFDLGSGDSVLLFQQTFASVAAALPSRTKQRPLRRGPTRID